MSNDDDRGTRIFMSEDHVFRDRTQGCWNCIHAQPGKVVWDTNRQRDLQRALAIALESPLGEGDQRVVNIRNMVDTTDHAVAAGALRHCDKGITALGLPVGDLVAHNYLCTKWTAAPGASLAREVGKTEKLPEELADDIGPMSPDDLKLKAGGEG